ncbi:hypothetical protein FB593_1126 [Rhizobium sp. SJZ105]|uniref:hypothetical protein n=1 Tax=Rhizobium sp. SJZ105 TaxID=2572678 RepID=UPI0011A8E199|nr:hypothetical protein [Rhizobium sp. SJZ105]TWC78322.1 hypothetical protein FB593_1126 [Rhizobium sp. SJZ105]
MTDKIIAMHEARTPLGERVTPYRKQHFADADEALATDVHPSAAATMELSDGRHLKLVGVGEYREPVSGEVFLLDQPGN